MNRTESVPAREAPAGGGGKRSAPMIEVDGLSCRIDGPEGTARLLRDVSLRVEKGRTVGIVGESGSGKSMLLRTALGLAPSAATVSGRVTLNGQDLQALSRRGRRKLVGRSVGMVFQNAMTSLNPVVRVGRQVSEASRKHLGLSRPQAKAKAAELLDLVGIPDAERRVRDYPHQFSGGMRQRIMIAMALACEPDLLVADEPTTALDVTVEREILDLLQRIQRERQMAMILVSHDMNIVTGRTDDVAVMYGGRLVEQAPTDALAHDHRHRYTEALFAAIPRLDHEPHARLPTIPGRPPSPLRQPGGCPFAPRCGSAIDVCESEFPPRAEGRRADHHYHCHVPVDRGSDSTPTLHEDRS